jgi:hypothetical protein
MFLCQLNGISDFFLGDPWKYRLSDSEKKENLFLSFKEKGKLSGYF